MSTNTLTGLIPTIYQGLDTVLRELVGFVPNVTMNANAEQAAVGQSIVFPITPTMTSSNITPANVKSEATGQTISNDSLTISKSKSVSFDWNGEEQASIGGLYNTVLANQFAQAFRVLANEVEADLAAAYAHASRAYGTAGTAPFGTANDLSDIAQVRKILEDNGAPTSDLRLILSTSAAANIRGKQSVLFKVNESGTADMLRNGNLGQLEGFTIGVSGGVKTHTAGTGAATYYTNTPAAATLAVGTTTIGLDTGSGTVLAGDIITFAGDTNKYVVNTALTAGDTVIGKPGLVQTLADGVQATLGASYKANLAFDRSAIQLVARQPFMPAGGDSAYDVMAVTDPVSGLTFQVAMYKGYRKTMFEVGLAWGTKVVKSEGLAILLG